MRSCKENDYFRNGVVIYLEALPRIGHYEYFLMQRNPALKKKYGVARMGWLYQGQDIPVATIREGIGMYMKYIAGVLPPAMIMRACAGTVKIVCGEREWVIPFPSQLERKGGIK